MVFEPLPQAFIYESILKPLFAGSPFEGREYEVCKPFLEVYRFLSECSSDKLLISPRKLQMMAAMFLAYQPLREEENLAAQHYAYQVAQHLVPKQSEGEFAQRFKPITALSKSYLSLTNLAERGFIRIPSRKPICNLLEDLLALHHRRTTTRNETLRYAGLGGLIIESAPGLGKSELSLAFLLANGFQELHPQDQQIPEKSFMRIPVSLPLAEKERLLLKTFHAGAIVIIDEINSCPMMERLLNSLLMGNALINQALW